MVLTLTLIEIIHKLQALQTLNLLLINPNFLMEF
jgi:hypothetical protein